MKKRFLSMLLVCAMLAAMLPAISLTASAAVGIGTVRIYDLGAPILGEHPNTNVYIETDPKAAASGLTVEIT